MSISVRRIAFAVAAAIGGTLIVPVVPAAAAPVRHGGSAPTVPIRPGDTTPTVPVRHREIAPDAPVRGGGSAPIYSYENAIRESVWVSTALDNDGDGVGDRIAVDIVRPREAAERRLKVPVVLEASPYNAWGAKGYDAGGTIAMLKTENDNYFVPRGYAFVAPDLAGTARSTGCTDVGGREEVLGAKAVIDWLNGRARAAYADGTPAVATGWTNGRTGMIGMSWDGSVANGVAATGVEGLETVVPIAAISSWYDYQRFNGVLRIPEYPAFLHTVVSARPPEACAAMLARLGEDSDDATGSYNAYWAERDYRRDARKVRASVFLVHGLNDINVKPTQFAAWWGRLDVPKKLWLSQVGHIHPLDIRRGEWLETLHRWFDRWLRDVPNGVDREPAVSIETTPGTWVDERSWPAVGVHQADVALGDGDGTTGTLGGRSGSGSRTWTDNLDLSEATAVATPGSAVPGRVAFLSAPLTEGVRISGTPSVTLRVKVDKPTTELSARLVDYGVADRVDYLNERGGTRQLDTETCWGASSATDEACIRDAVEDVVTSDHGILTRGWTDAAHYRTLRTETPLRPDRWYSVTVPLQATDQRIAAGHALGLIVMASDNDYHFPHRSTGATVRLDLRGSSLTLPLVGTLPAPAATAPEVAVRPRIAARQAPPLLP
ncbi:X-Pro dipeptidyl-peptidase [Actinoplanes sp. NBRC 14428]|nr:X-Pro dipeptidyl-peptidase [Actinoplanes sp. NBRC 14428]